MKERPILFSAPMVRALLDGSKTQTRRVVNHRHLAQIDLQRGGCTANWSKPMPYGQPGDRLWVRENGWERPERTPKMMREGADTWEPYYFDADGLTDQDSEDFKAWGFKRRPSIHMPRTASRINLEITRVRVERLQDISERDAMAEGVKNSLHLPGGRFARENFEHLWWSINGEGSWEANPWVWVVEFKRVTP
jgi:hypothetical protein